MNDYIGDIQLFPYGFEILDYFICDGRSLPVSQFDVLFSLIGTTYGGDSTYFNLPNMLGEEPIPGMNYYICYNGLYPTRN